MKKIIFYLLICLSVPAFAQDWQYDLDQAKIEAKQNQKQILLVFSGSDWCAPCIKLDQEIWQTDTFKKHALKKLVLVKADFPKLKSNRLSKEQNLKNAALADKYNPNGYFPLVILLNKNGEVINQLGYKNLSPEQYISAIYEK
jgi:thioredoxin-related protein